MRKYKTNNSTTTGSSSDSWTSPIPTSRTSMNPKRKLKMNKTTEIKRSERLSRKRSFQNELNSVKDNLDDLNHSNNMNKIKKFKNSHSNETRSEKSTISSNSTKKLNNRSSVPEMSVKNSTNNSDSGKASNAKPSSSITKENDTSNVLTKNQPKTPKNKITQKSIKCTTQLSIPHLNEYKTDEIISNELDEENDNSFVFTRKRGCPTVKKVKLKKLDDVVNTFRSNVNHHKAENLSVIVKKLISANKSPFTQKLDNNTVKIISANTNNKLQKMKKKETENKLSIEVEIKTDESNNVEAIKKPDIFKEVDKPITSTESTPVRAELLSDVNDEKLQIMNDLGTLERDIDFLSKRFSIPSKSVKHMIIEDSLSVFRKKYSESITPSMITISPIVTNDFEDNLKHDEGSLSSGDLDLSYKIEPIRESAAHLKTNLKDLMDELTKTMRSWSLTIVNDPPRYVISEMSIDMYGIPTVSKSIVLDRQFRASVYINQCLQYKYCKRYERVTEILKLIQMLNSEKL